jgi:hypothetical protein
MTQCSVHLGYGSDSILAGSPQPNYDSLRPSDSSRFATDSARRVRLDSLRRARRDSVRRARADSIRRADSIKKANGDTVRDTTRKRIDGRRSQSR